MKPVHYGILLLISILLASITFVSPWAEAVFHKGEYGSPWFDQVEETQERLTLPIYFWDRSLRVDGCPRGPVEGLNDSLDGWIWLGRVMSACQAGLWLSFLLGAAFRKGYKILAISSAGLIVIFILFFLALNPIVECLYTEFPAPLIYAHQWQINIWSPFLCILNIAGGVWLNTSIYKFPIKPKVS